MNVSQLHQTFKPRKKFVTLDLLEQSIGFASVQQLVKEKYSIQLQAMNVTVNNLTLEERKKCSQLDRYI